MKKIYSFDIIVISLALLLSSCGQPANVKAARDPSNLNGTISVSGAFALYPMMVRWGEEYKKVHPGVQFDISAGGAGKGMSDALSGAADMGMVSRSITPEEEAKGAYWVSVTKDAVFVVVNSNNPVVNDLHKKGLTKDILTGIYITGKITTWGQVVGRTEVTDPIHVFTRSDAAGAPDTLAKFLGKAQEDLQGVGVFGDPGILDSVAKDPLAIGYNNLGYAYDMQTSKPTNGTTIVPLDFTGNGQVDPGQALDTKQQAIQSVLTGKYPSPPARNLNLVTKGKPSGLVQAFIEWILTDGQKYVEEAGFIPLTSDQIAKEQAKIR